MNAFPTPGNALQFPSQPVAWKEITTPVQPFLARVNARLLEQIQEFDPEIAPYASYALAAQGKQLRPVIVGLSAMTCGEMGEEQVTSAVIIEMVHLATLLHDDVMDEAEIRRGRATLSKRWGNEMSILVGDCLFALALKLAASFTTPEVCRAVAAATNQVCSGEILQTRRRRDFRLTREECLKALEMKTAELFALACELGAGGASTGDSARMLRQYGIAWGTAYQIYDDCVDLFGSELEAGKSLGTDLDKGKLTLPMLVAWEKGTTGERKELQQMIENWSPADFPKFKELLEKYDSLGESVRMMEQYLCSAKEILHTLPDSEGKKGLLLMADYLWQQSRGLKTAA